MPVAVLSELDMLNAETYDAVNAKMGVRDNPPEGMIFHAAGPKEGGGWRIFDVWQDEAAFHRFAEERLTPAVMEVTEGRGAENPPRREIYELHELVTP